MLTLELVHLYSGRAPFLPPQIDRGTANLVNFRLVKSSHLSIAVRYDFFKRREDGKQVANFPTSRMHGWLADRLRDRRGFELRVFAERLLERCVIPYRLPD